MIATAGGGIRVEDLDTGPGGPEENLERIFEPWFRVPRPGAATDAPAGTGLGLAIARRVFALDGGRVVAGNRPGGGLVLEVRLPAAQIS